MRDVLRRMTELRIIEVASQLSVRPGGAELACDCYQVLADVSTGHDCVEHLLGILLTAERALGSAA